MAMINDSDRDKICLQHFFGVCPAGVLVVSHLCFDGRWCLGGLLVGCP